MSLRLFLDICLWNITCIKEPRNQHFIYWTNRAYFFFKSSRTLSVWLFWEFDPITKYRICAIEISGKQVSPPNVCTRPIQKISIEYPTRKITDVLVHVCVVVVNFSVALSIQLKHEQSTANKSSRIQTRTDNRSQWGWRYCVHGFSSCIRSLVRDRRVYKTHHEPCAYRLRH